MPAPTPFTMEDVVNGVLTQLRYAPGRDVQIHLQEGIMQDASILYRTLMTRYIWRDFLFMTPFTTNAANGTPTTDLTAKLTKFSDIYSVYGSSKEEPLPFAPALVNPTRLSAPTVLPVGQPKVFAIYPTGSAADYILWSRNFSDQDFDLDDPVPFYKDILVVGTAYMLCLKSGINKELTETLRTQFDNLVQMYRMDEVKPQYSAKPYRSGNVMEDWVVTGT